MQAEKLLALRQKLDKTQESLQREQHRVQLLEAELQHLRCSQSACLSRRMGVDSPQSEVRLSVRWQGANNWLCVAACIGVAISSTKRSFEGAKYPFCTRNTMACWYSGQTAAPVAITRTSALTRLGVVLLTACC